MRIQHGATIEASLSIAADRAGDLTPLVYERLFARYPAMRAEFWRDGSGAIRGEMLARVFETILDLAGPRVSADAMIGCEIITHDAYGIPREIFAAFFEIVGNAVETVCGPDWTPAMAVGWAELLGEIGAVIVANEATAVIPRLVAADQF